PTTMTQSNDNIKRALKNIVKCKNTQDCKTAAEIIGIHLEGPFISKDKVGAQNPRFVETPSINKVEHFQNIADNQIKIITIAPEVKGAEETISRWSENIIFSIGHTLADYEQVNFSVTKGVRHITHLYNASSNFTHRNLGVVGAAWTNNKLSAEIIVDGIHSHPEAIDIAYKLKGNQSLYLITDSMRAKGMPDGEYDLGGQSVTVNHPEARLSTGELAGSILRMIDGFKNLIHFTNGSISDLWPLTSLNQARALNISEAKGSIEIGKDADLVVLKDDISLKMTVKGGTMHYS
ncbi:N-acetylglucosamine-6-phosphate deacetylase, partial [Staphylococcus epidermidis]|nr:N-acetylglucosamine-6-phosphate deacetylase [Staphylococcus epidermidis]